MNLEQISRDQYVLKKFAIPTLASLQVVKIGRRHFFKFGDDQNSQNVHKMLDLAEIFAVSHESSCDTLSFYAALKVAPHQHIHQSNCHPSNPSSPDKNSPHNPNNHSQILRLGVYQFKIKQSGNVGEGGADSENFLALYEELVHIIDAQNMAKGMPRRLLLFVNPHSGENMRACRTFTRYVSPILKLASISFKVIVLTYPTNPLRLDAEELGQKWALPKGDVELAFEFPYDYCYKTDISEFDGVISVSGDGTLSDAVLGTLKQINGVKGEILPTAELKRITRPIFGVIPAGSTDTMALTVYGTNDPLTAILNIVSGHRVGIDAQGLFDSPAGFSPENKNYSLDDSKLCRFCFTAVGGGGFMPKVIEMSKDIRPVFRAQRFSAAAVPIFLGNKPHNMVVYYKATHSQPKDFRHFCGVDCSHCSGFAGQNPCNMAIHAASEPWTRSSYSNFMGVNVATNASLSKYQAVGLSPHAHLGDGSCDLVLNKHMPTIFHYLALQRKAMLLSYDMYDLAKHGMEYVRAWEYSVEPADTADDANGVVEEEPDNRIQEPKLLCSADGELFKCRRLHGVVYCQLFFMYGSGRPIPAPSK